MHNKSPSTDVSQTQNVNINSDKKSKINLNKASLEELKSLQGVGDKLANKIIEGRPYKSVWDLKKVNGIGEETIRNIMEVVNCE